MGGTETFTVFLRTRDTKAKFISTKQTTIKDQIRLYFR